MTIVSALLCASACGGEVRPTSPTPVPVGDGTTANVYILPGAVALGPGAFGDHPIVIYRGERMRWRNIDGADHNLVPDTASLPEFVPTGLLAPGGERSFLMATNGTTTFHCTIHPQMVGTLIVQDR
ncbi:MAG TPA: plastocyanin/azurin family copper-binding protein [Vicinamibacterales bacterium]